MALTALPGQPQPDVTGAELVVQVRTSITSSPVFELAIGAGITMIDGQTVRLAASAAQTALIHADVALFALGRRDGGPRDITPVIKWPVVQGFTR